MSPDLTWETFVANLVDHYAQRNRESDRVLWRVAKGDRTMTCREREIRTATYIGLELRVEHNDQVYRTEVHTERVAFYRRVEELRATLEAEGWTLTR
jgi:hypothetical protein